MIEEARKEYEQEKREKKKAIIKNVLRVMDSYKHRKRRDIEFYDTVIANAQKTLDNFDKLKTTDLQQDAEFYKHEVSKISEEFID